jgi:imidazolonepropionase-like amidohydrolase
MAGRSAATDRRCVGRWGLVAVLLLAWPAARASGAALVIQGVSMFDAASRKMQPNRTVVVSGEKIEPVGTPERPVAVPPGAVVIDGKGKFLIPGLIDAHVHLVHRPQLRPHDGR